MTDTSTYHGPATVIFAEERILVIATLTGQHRAGLTSWRGQVTAQPTEDFWSVLEAGQAKLLLPNGNTGDFIHARTAVGSGRLNITGSGPAPF